MNIPDSFVRFYGNPEFALDCIENKQLTLIHTSKFNDPFDPVLDFTLECDWNYDSFIQWVVSNKKQLDAKDIARNKEGWISTKTKLENFFNNIRATMFMACFCTAHIKNGNATPPQENLYMWGHYGNGHRGVAIEFKKGIFISNAGEIGIDHVEYRDALPIITNAELYEFMFNGNVDIINAKHGQILRTKTKNWEPEQEWRFCMTNKITKLPWIKAPLPENSIQSVYLGCQINSHISEQINTQVKNFHPNAKIYQARQDLKHLKLLFDAV